MYVRDAMSLFETIVEANKDMDISQLKIEKFNDIFNGKIEGRVTKYGVDSEQIFDNFNIILNLNKTPLKMEIRYILILLTLLDPMLCGCF